MSGLPSPGKKRKASAAAAPAAGGGAAKPAAKKQLHTGISSLLARLEATNASFLQTAAAADVATQMARVKARRAGRGAAKRGRLASHPFLLRGRLLACLPNKQRPPPP